jgi:hypothetical protein
MPLEVSEIRERTHTYKSLDLVLRELLGIRLLDSQSVETSQHDGCKHTRLTRFRGYLSSSVGVRVFRNIRVVLLRVRDIRVILALRVRTHEYSLSK